MASKSIGPVVIASKHIADEEYKRSLIGRALVPFYSGESLADAETPYVHVGLGCPNATSMLPSS